MTAAQGFGVFYVAAIVTAVVVPLLATGGRSPRAIIAAAGLAGLAGLTVGVAGAGVPFGRLSLATGTVFSFGVFIAGLSHLATGGTRAWAAPLVAGFAIVLLATPFVTDAVLEDRAGRVRPVVRAATLYANPAMWIAGPDQLGVDWLRRPRLYEVARLGAFHRYRYPAGAYWPLLWMLAGAAFIACARAPSRAASGSGGGLPR